MAFTYLGCFVFNKRAMALSNWHFNQTTLAAVQKKIIEELSSGSRELAPSCVKGLISSACCFPSAYLTFCPPRSPGHFFCTRCTCACPPISGCTTVTRFCVFAPFSLMVGVVLRAFWSSSVV